MSPRDSGPVVSILLPTFNRAEFLLAAFESIRAQTWHNWELVIVDDGSTDDTEQVLRKFQEETGQSVIYVKQANAGAYGARNTALDRASGEYVAFFDSDDLWLPHHLEACVEALNANPDVDWAYGACRIVDYASRTVLAANTFFIDDAPRPFVRLAADVRGALHVLPPDGLVECALLHGLYCGLQNSVLRRKVFDRTRFEAALRNEAEDQFFTIRAIKRGHRLGYLDNVHVQYHVHDTNSSGSATGSHSLERQRRLLEPLVTGLEQLRQELEFTSSETVALKQRLHRECFWHLGYAVYKSRGRYSDALAWFRRGLREWPWSAAAWKTYAATRLRAMWR